MLIYSVYLLDLRTRFVEAFFQSSPKIAPWLWPLRVNSAGLYATLGRPAASAER